MRIVIIGAGNVGTILGKKIKAADHEVVQVVSRNVEHASNLGKTLEADYTSDYSKINSKADMYVLAISDMSLAGISQWLKLDKKLVVHTAASVEKNILIPVSRNYGVLYPLQSLRKEMKVLPDIPLLVDGNTRENLTLIYDFATTLSQNVQVADDNQRLKLHVSAVFVNNFTNHLFSLVEEYCNREKIEFSLLLPLLLETSARLKVHSPRNMQTGPALRNEEITINKHLQLLEAHPHLKSLYKILTESIREFYVRSR